MPVKKKTSKKRKKASSSKSNSKSTSSSTSEREEKDSELQLPDEPSTLMSPTPSASLSGSKGKKKKSKTSKPKLTKAERAHAKLEKAITALKENDAYYISFLERMHNWLLQKVARATQIYKHMDPEGEGVVTVDDFKAGLFDLNVPLNKVEIHLLTRLLDPDDTGEVDYTVIPEGLTSCWEAYNAQKDAEFKNTVLVTTPRQFPPCPCCRMSINGPPADNLPRFLNVTLRMLTFDKFKDYPGHIEVLVHSHLLVCRLIHMIMEQTDITSSKIAIFRDTTRSKDAVLPALKTLEDCGYPGDSRNNPQNVNLYYDYTVEFTDCPILLCDHYFGKAIENQMFENAFSAFTQ